MQGDPRKFLEKGSRYGQTLPAFITEPMPELTQAHETLATTRVPKYSDLGVLTPDHSQPPAGAETLASAHFHDSRLGL